jgi:hypothetical protein
LQKTDSNSAAYRSVPDHVPSGHLGLVKQLVGEGDRLTREESTLPLAQALVPHDMPVVIIVLLEMVDVEQMMDNRELERLSLEYSSLQPVTNRK